MKFDMSDIERLQQAEKETAEMTEHIKDRLILLCKIRGDSPPSRKSLELESLTKLVADPKHPANGLMFHLEEDTGGNSYYGSDIDHYYISPEFVTGGEKAEQDLRDAVIAYHKFGH